MRISVVFLILLLFSACLSLDRLHTKQNKPIPGSSSHQLHGEGQEKSKISNSWDEKKSLSSFGPIMEQEDEGEEEEFVDLPTPGPSPWGKKIVRLPPQAIDWPVDEARLTRGYFLKHPTRKKGRPHLGLDLANKRGTPIFSAHDGVVIYVGRGFRGYGRMIMIEAHNGDYATLYAHLLKTRVRQGYQIKQGDWIGDMGSTGRSTGPHLHFEIRTLAGPVDPLLYLPPVRPERIGHQWGVGRQMIAWDQLKKTKSEDDMAPEVILDQETSAAAHE